MASKRLQPNILFFFTDQQRWDTVGAYGQPLALTPNFDRLAAEGVRFDKAITCQPVCGPARSCLQTGKYATEVGCYRNGIALPRNLFNLIDFSALSHTVPVWDSGRNDAFVLCHHNLCMTLVTTPQTSKAASAVISCEA